MKHNIIKTDSEHIVLDLMLDCNVKISVHWSWWYFKFIYHVEFLPVTRQ